MKYLKIPVCLAFFFSLHSIAAADQFKRGDGNVDGEFNIADPVMTLAALYMGAASPDCDDAMDINDNGRLDITDVTYSLEYLFLGGPSPRAPFPDCGDDPRADSLGCDFYPPCIECLGQEDLDEIINESVVPTACLPAGSAEVDLGLATVLVCPEDSAGECGDPLAPGCEVQINNVKGDLDVPGEEITVHLEGTIEDLPIKIIPFIGGPTVCTDEKKDDIIFAGDLVVAFETEPAGTEFLRITEIHDPATENVEVTLNYEGGFLCDLLEDNKDLLIENFIDQLQEQMADLILELRAEFVGSYLCK